MSETIRCFIALELPSSVQNFIKIIQSSLTDLNCDIKWVKPQNAHLTLKFLGNVPSDKITPMTTALEALFLNKAESSDKISEMGYFPAGHPPRILWVGMNDQNHYLSDIAQEMDKCFRFLKLPKEKRKFKAHITIGRIRSLKNISNLIDSVGKISVPDNLIVPIEKITLFKSTLTPEGPIYETLQSFPFQK